MNKLRPYQNESVNELAISFKTHKRVIFVLPTGGGKTVCFSEIAFRASKKGTTVLVLTDRVELFTQTSKAILKHNIPIVKIDAKNKNLLYTEAKLFVAMVETIKRRMDKLKHINPSLIIIDEAHKGNFFKVIDAFPDAMVIGATATPVNKQLHKYYQHIVQVIDIPELVEQGFLSPCKAFQMQDNFDDVKTDSTGEFETNSLYKHFNKSKLYEGVIDEYLKRCKGTKTVVFNVNIEHSNQMCEAFNKIGIKSYSVTSKTSDQDRKFILEEFEKGNFPVLNNCGILTTGWDEPSLETVIMNRATKSLPLWLQCCGRGSRIYPGKTHFTILDFGMNHDRHGLWNQPRVWELKEPKKKKEGDGVAPVKKCPKCEAILPAQAKSCEHCKHEFPVSNELKKGEMIEVTERIPSSLKGKRLSELSTDELIELEKTKLYKSPLIWRVIRSRGEHHIREYAAKKGYKAGWIYNQIKDKDNSQFNDFIIKEAKNV